MAIRLLILDAEAVGTTKRVSEEGEGKPLRMEIQRLFPQEYSPLIVTLPRLEPKFPRFQGSATSP